MIDKLHVLDVIHTALEGSDKFLVDLKITTDNRIFVAIDGDNGINIDDCIALSRTIESNLNREEEDFELNVASAGLDSPLKLTRQYKNNVGRILEVTTFDGEHVEGKLLSADDEQFTLKPEQGRRRMAEPVTFLYKDVKTAKIVVIF